MTKIEYKPHCGKCGALINKEISYQDIIIESGAISECLYSRDIAIEPYRCEHCDEMFNLIEIKMPKKDGEIRIK